MTVTGRTRLASTAPPSVTARTLYELDDPQRHAALAQYLLKRPVGVVGISMGGYGALKLGFTRPERFGAIAAVSPMVEPALYVDEVRPRNRFHYPPQVPAALLGPDRDPRLYAADHPAHRARTHADRIRSAALAIYIDAASRDALNAHDGAEFLHRVLWELDLVHEYRLHADADHVGPSLVPRLMEAFTWVLDHLHPSPRPLDEVEQAWCDWLEAGSPGQPPAPLPPTSSVFPRVLRTMIEPARQQAAHVDSSVARTYGLLPEVHPPDDGSCAGEHPALCSAD